MLGRLEEAFGADAALLARHSDEVHGRTVLTLAAEPGALTSALMKGAAATAAAVDLSGHRGAHPRIGALDVCPVVFTDPARAAVADATAMDVAEGLAELGLPVFLYGRLAAGEERRERHFFRAGGVEALRGRMAAGLRPDLGPAAPHPSAGAVLVTARPPLAAFNVELGGAGLAGAKAVAAGLREAGGGMPGVRAIAIDLGGGRMQISTNVHDPAATPLAAVVAEVERLAAPIGGQAVAAELIGLIPERALEGYPEHIPIRGFDPESGTIEAALRSLG